LQRSIARSERNVKPWTACVATKSYVTKVTGGLAFILARAWVGPDVRRLPLDASLPGCLRAARAPRFAGSFSPLARRPLTVGHAPVGHAPVGHPPPSARNPRQRGGRPRRHPRGWRRPPLSWCLAATGLARARGHGPCPSPRGWALPEPAVPGTSRRRRTERGPVSRAPVAPPRRRRAQPPEPICRWVSASELPLEGYLRRTPK
jgi:hypothetical protein